MRRIGLIIGHGRCPALICGLILDVADVCLEWRQPTHVDQAVVLAAINISSRVFTSVARDDLTDQLEILIVHVTHHFFALSPISPSRLFPDVPLWLEPTGLG